MRALKKRQIAAPPSCVSSFRDGSAAGARNDESNSVAARPFASANGAVMVIASGKGAWQSAFKLDDMVEKQIATQKKLAMTRKIDGVMANWRHIKVTAE